jgi:hypothetical protein
LCCALFALAQPVTAAAAGGTGTSESLNNKTLGELANSAPETQTSTTSTSTSTRNSESGSSTSRTLILVALGAAVVLLSGIGFVIVRDARRVAPAGDADLDGGRGGRDTAARMRKRRAKAKAARQQRKRNR